MYISYLFIHWFLVWVSTVCAADATQLTTDLSFSSSVSLVVTTGCHVLDKVCCCYQFTECGYIKSAVVASSSSADEVRICYQFNECG